MKLYLDGSTARVDRRVNRLPRHDHVYQTWRYIEWAVNNTDHDDDYIVARAKALL